MFTAPNDIAMGGNQPMVYQNNQQHAQQRPQQQQQQQQQMFPQYGGYQPQQQQQQQPQQQHQQQQQYLAYQNAGANVGKGGNVNAVAFQPYVPQQQQMFPYSYPPQQAPNAQYAPPAPQPTPQQQPPPPQQYQHPQQQQPQPRHLGYHPQGSANATNQYMAAGGGAGQPAYRGGRGRGAMAGGYGAFHRQVHNSYYYNQQHHYSSNNAVPEKTPTVHLLHPDTHKVISVKLNRIYSTMADIRPQLQHQKGHHHPHSNSSTAGADSNEVSTSTTDEKSNERSQEKVEVPAQPKFDPKSTKLTLCLNFLSSHGCIHGSGCDKVHIAGLEYTWPQVEPTETEKDGKRAYAAGFHVHCYDPTLTRYYKVPSESVYVTKGSSDYVTMFNDHGDNFKMKYKLCSSVVERAECSKGEECEDIHCAVADLETVRENSANATHINNAEAMADVARLPAEMTVRVFNQNSFDTWHDYPGTNVLMTEGAKAYQKQYEQEMNNVPTRKRMQHCAHFRLKDMCRLGESCRFLHVLPTEQEIKERKEAEAAKEAEAEKEASATAEGK